MDMDPFSKVAVEQRQITGLYGALVEKTKKWFSVCSDAIPTFRENSLSFQVHRPDLDVIVAKHHGDHSFGGYPNVTLAADNVQMFIPPSGALPRPSLPRVAAHYFEDIEQLLKDHQAVLRFSFVQDGRLYNRRVSLYYETVPTNAPSA